MQVLSPRRRPLSLAPPLCLAALSPLATDPGGDERRARHRWPLPLHPPRRISQQKPQNPPGPQSRQRPQPARSARSARPFAAFCSALRRLQGPQARGTADPARHDRVADPVGASGPRYYLRLSAVSARSLRCCRLLRVLSADVPSLPARSREPSDVPRRSMVQDALPGLPSRRSSAMRCSQRPQQVLLK